MSEWIYGEEVLADVHRQMLRERGFPDADECPMPVEHTGDVEIDISAEKTWDEL